MDEYKTHVGKVFILGPDNKQIRNLENVLNEYAMKGYEFVSLHQYHFDGLQFSLVMKRVVQ